MIRLNVGLKNPPKKEHVRKNSIIFTQNIELESESYMGDTKRPKAKIFPAIRK